jgi:methylenetetrahydrofolate dehydrogenase (NADP+)/methenyltetrahydrofolate cyclohydrolase
VVPLILDGNHGLAVILASSDPASAIYVRGKTKTAGELGIYNETITPPSTVTTDELVQMVRDLNARPEIDAILVQLPLWPGVDSQRVLNEVAPEKDVDGFHPYNVGLLAMGKPGSRPCTPNGVIQMLKRYEIPIAGRNAVVVGRSDIVGKPMALLLLQENATVTICHSKTADLPAVCRGADILVAAIGRAAMITADYIKPGAVVVDVGQTKIDSREQALKIWGEARMADFDRRGSLLVGDVHPGDMARVSSAYTPVPGGVGPLTIAMLMRNTVDSAEQRTGL